MAIKLFEDNNKTQASETKREKTIFWLNVGYEDPNSGEFIALPIGLPLDNMKPREVRPLSADPTPEAIKFNQQVEAGNYLLEALMKAAHGMKEGTAEKIPALSIQLRRVNVVGSAMPTDNPFIDALRADMNI